MIEGSDFTDVRAASRQGRPALIITPRRLITDTRHALEDSGAALEHIRLCAPDRLHEARGLRFDVVAVDSHARMDARAAGHEPELESFIEAARRG